MIDNQYEEQQTTYGKRITQEKNSLENVINFKRGKDSYNLKTRKFARTKKRKFEETWMGGYPLYCENDKKNVFYDQSDSHALVIGSTGSKKSRLVVMPTIYLLASAGESMIISDPKGEIYQRTATYLHKNGYDIYVLNIRNPDLGNSWNPLYIPFCYYKNGQIDKANEMINDIAHNIALADVSLKDPFWDHAAGSVLSGLILLLFKYCFLNKLPDDTVNFENLIRLRMELFGREDFNLFSHPLWEMIKDDTVIMSALNGTITAADRTKASILCVLDEKIRFLSMSQTLINMLSNNDFDIGKIREHRSAIYLIVPDEKTTYHKLISMFIKQSYEYLISLSYEVVNSGCVRINYILDEFSSLPAMQDFPSMISAARSRNIRYMLVIQSQHQLFRRYAEEAQTIMANCTTWYFLTSRETDLLEKISTLCGVDEKNKPLLSVSRLQRLDKEKGECLIFSGRLKPFISTLMEINEYDGGEYKILPFQKRGKNITEKILFSECVFHEPQRQSKISGNELLERSNLDEELQKKFDELFGSPKSDEEGTDE